VHGWDFVSTAEIKERLRPGFVSEDCFDEDLRDAAYEEALGRCRDALLAGRVSIVDAGFHLRSRRTLLYRVVSGGGLVLLYCRCSSRAEVFERIQRRRKAVRVPDVHGDCPELFAYLDSHFEEPDAGEFPPGIPVALVGVDTAQTSSGVELDGLFGPRDSGYEGSVYSVVHSIRGVLDRRRPRPLLAF
jgi:hypothetical protein